MRNGEWHTHYPSTTDREVPRRVPPSSREIHGATLEVSTMGGYSVHYEGAYLGYIHATVGGVWNTYRRVPGGPDDWLGRHREDDAVYEILAAWGRVPGRAAV